MFRGTFQAALGLTLGLAACQDYDFHHIAPAPVVVINKRAAFNADAGQAYIMIVQDTSGSMCEPISSDAGLATSGPGEGDCAAIASQSKLSLVASDFSAVLTGLLDGGLSAFNIGLTDLSGTDGACLAVTAPTFAVAPASTNIAKIVQWYATADAGGGTPTAATLNVAATGLSGAAGSRYMILLTDGFPNCGQDNPCAYDPSANQWSDGIGHGCVSPSVLASETPSIHATSPDNGAHCVCGNGSCPDPNAGNADSQCCFVDQAQVQANTSLDSELCLDDLSTDTTLANLYATGITTYVVGVGYDFNTNTSVLDGMAQAGSGNQVTSAYYANNEASLLLAIQQIIGMTIVVCNFTLDASPASPALIEVTLDGNSLTYGDSVNGFTFDPASDTVTLGTQVCTAVKSGSHTVDVTALGKT